MLADFCFSDLLLFVPRSTRTAERFVVLGQVRPSTEPDPLPHRHDRP